MFVVKVAKSFVQMGPSLITKVSHARQTKLGQLIRYHHANVNIFQLLSSSYFIFADFACVTIPNPPPEANLNLEPYSSPLLIG